MHLHVRLLTLPASPPSYGFDLGTKAGTPGGPFIEGMNQGVEGMLVRVTSMPTCTHALCPHSHLHAAQVGGQRKIIGAPRALRLPACCGC